MARAFRLFVAVVLASASAAIAAEGQTLVSGVRTATREVAPTTLVPDARVRVTTVELRTLTGRLVSADAEGIELELTEGEGKGGRETVELEDVKTVDVSRGKAGRGWSAVRGTWRGARGAALLLALWGAVAYDDPDLQYGSAAEGALFGAATGALIGGAIGAVIGTAARIERWTSVPDAQYRLGVVPARPGVPYRQVRIGAGWNAQYRAESTDVDDLDGLWGGSAAQAFSLGVRVGETSRVALEIWRPARVVVPAERGTSGVTRRFRDTVVSLVATSDFAATRRVRPYLLSGISFIRVDERALSDRRASSGFVLGAGAEVSIGRHVAVAPDVRINLPWEALLLGLPYGMERDAWSLRASFRPSLSMVVRF